MKKLSSFLMMIVIIISACAVPASAGRASFTYGIVYPAECEELKETIGNVFLAQYGIALNEASGCTYEILLKISGDSSDFSIKYDGDGQCVTLNGGSVIALKYAVNKFLEMLLITGDEAPDFSSVPDYSYCAETDGTDNSALLSYEPDDEVKLMPSWSDGMLYTSDRADSLIITELRPDMASIGGTLPECRDLIDFYASVGVNCIWLPPIYDRGENGNGYSNYGPDTLEPAITGTDDYDEGWEIVKDFIDYAHGKGIYVILDMVTWGTVFDSPLVEEHPDWFDGEAWGNAAFNWDSTELRDWFVRTATENILKTGADGYRCDCEPNYTGYDIYGRIRQNLKAEGKNIIIICEDADTRQGVYDFEQDGVLDYSVTDRAGLYSDPINFFGDGYVNIVDSVKKGKGIGYSGWQDNPLKRGNARYYINCLTNHDYERRDICGNEINIGYSAILAPYIPLWYMGDEFNATSPDGVQYFNFIDYGEIYDADNALFLESVKKMISIRRTYSDIFEYFPANHRNGNICKVETEGLGTLQSYARYAGNRAVLVIPGSEENPSGGSVKIPFGRCNISGYGRYRITDLTTGKILKEGSRKETEEFSTYIGSGNVGIYMVEGIGTCSALNIDFSSILDSLYASVLNVFAAFGI